MEHHTVPDEQHPSGMGAASTEWVTMRMVWPWPLTFSNIRKRSAEDAESRAPVGSSAKSSLGPGDHGPGHGGALLLAAGYLIGELVQDVLDAQRLGQGQQGLLHLLHTFSRQNQGQEDIVLNGKGIQQVKLLEYKAQVVPAEGGQVPLRDGLQTLPDKSTSPAVGLSRAARIFSRVVLPEPDSPMMATYSPSCTEKDTPFRAPGPAPLQWGGILFLI